MPRYRFDKICKPTTLYKEIVDAFPWVEHDVQMETHVERVTDCLMLFDAAGVSIAVPESVDADLLAAVVAAHDPLALSATEQAEQIEESDRALRLQAIRDDLLALVGRDVLSLTEPERWLLVGAVLRKAHVITASGTVSPVENWRLA